MTIAEWVKRSTAAQNLKEKTSDQSAIEGLVKLIRAMKSRRPTG